MLVEQPGAWGQDALTESRLPTAIGQRLKEVAGGYGIRVILIRRGARLTSDRRNVYFARTQPEGSWLSHTDVGSAEELLDIDLEPLGAGLPVANSQPVDHPLFLVCTHGRHDTCCSVRGNQVSRLACSAYPRFAWECSHIGGDRFAANVVCFPHGIYYGRVGPAELVDLIESYVRGWVNLNHYRGVCRYTFPLQAAEYFLRREANVLGVDDVELSGYERGPAGELSARFGLADGRSAEVVVRTSLSADWYRLTCRAEKDDPIPFYDLVSCSIPEN